MDWFKYQNGKGIAVENFNSTKHGTNVRMPCAKWSINDPSFVVQYLFALCDNGFH